MTVARIRQEGITCANDVCVCMCMCVCVCLCVCVCVCVCVCAHVYVHCLGCDHDGILMIFIFQLKFTIVM